MYPAAEQGVDVRYVTVGGGIRLRVLESSGERDGSRATRGTLLLVHGFGASVYSFAGMLPALTAAGFHVFAVDLPGHGLSDKPVRDDAYTTQALANAVLDAASVMGIDRCTIVGHSMGGAIALEIARRGERLVQAMVLISPAGVGRAPAIGVVKPISPRLVNRVVPALLSRALVNAVLHVAFAAPNTGRPTSRDVDEYWAPTQFDEFAWACRSCVHQFSWKPLPDDVLERLRVPVLVITGGRDRVIRGVAERAHLIPGSRLVAIPDGGHVVVQEYADRVSAEISQFLQGVS